MRTNLEARAEIIKSESIYPFGVVPNKPKGWVEVERPRADEYGYPLTPTGPRYEP